MSEIQEGVRKAIMAGVGAVAMTAEKSKELIDQLVKKGESVAGQQGGSDGGLRHGPQDADDAVARAAAALNALTSEQRRQLFAQYGFDAPHEGA
ncbi:MAG: hypothetical protein GX558_04680 [Clostridiales bacterium]|nr:hypothetical protein [Clostridiales bacterium]